MNGKRHVSSVRVALDEDWTAQAGTLEWSCLRTADHGIGAAFEPPAPLAHRLREHTRPWPAWTATWDQLGHGPDPGEDLLAASRSVEHNTALQALMRRSSAVLCS